MPFEPGVEIDLREVDSAFRAMASAGKNLRPVFAKLKPLMFADQVDHHKKQEGPDGKWPPRADATRAKKRRGKLRTTKRALGNQMRTAFNSVFSRAGI